MGPAGKKDVNGYREGVRVETPAHSLCQASVGWAGYGGGFRVFAHDEGRVHRNERVPPEEEKGQRRGPGPP